ncbi:MAG: hypothetical protein JWP34_5063, partial [Massilia sp.]|nr:hypothetical protein [Massilia sp.]
MAALAAQQEPKQKAATAKLFIRCGWQAHYIW